MSLNVELLRKVRDAIADEDNPVGFDMGAWGWEVECGSACCIAGHAMLRSGRDIQNATTQTASDILGITPDDGHHLFYGGWVDREDRNLEDITLEDITRAEAVAYLDRCIEAGKIVR